MPQQIETPKPKIRNLFEGRSFVAKISDAIRAPEPATFSAFPQGVHFSGQDDGEQIVLILRVHPIMLVKHFLEVIFILAIGLIIWFYSEQIFSGFEYQKMLASVLLIASGMLAVTVAFDSFIKWFYSVSIITTQRITRVTFDRISAHAVAETQLERVEDIRSDAPGFWSTFFDYGNIYIQTAGEEPEFLLKAIPRVRDVHDTIFDLLELKQPSH